MAEHVTSPDSGGLCPRQLSSNELDIILKIERHARSIRERPKASTETVWPIAQTRHERVILLDGDRGSGKTSLMWTLVERWNRSTFDAKELQASYVERASIAEKDAASIKMLGAPPENIRVLSMLDFDPLPPSMPVVAGMVQAWRPLAEELLRRLRAHRPQALDDDSVVDHWQNLFQTAAAGWGKLGERKTLIDQILDQEEQIGDWATLGAEWQKFIARVIAAGKLLPDEDPYHLDEKTVFVIMIDDCDLQVERMQEILPAIRLLYDGNVLFIVSADRKHMLDMLELDYLGKQNLLSNRQIVENGFDQNDRWARALAEASFEKVFPTRHRLRLPRLPLTEVLRYPAASSHSAGEGTFASLFASWEWDENSGDAKIEGNTLPNTPKLLSEYLSEAAAIIDELKLRLPIATYRTLKQSWDRIRQDADTPEEVRQAVARLISGAEYDDVIAAANPTAADEVPDRIVFTRKGLLTAQFEEQLSTPFATDSWVRLSASPAFFFDHDGVNRRLDKKSRPAVSPAEQARTSQTIIAVSLQDDAYNVDAASVDWQIRRAIAWTHHLRPQPMVFSWPRIYHPSPLRLVRWANDWRRAVSDARALSGEARRWRMAYDYIVQQRIWTEKNFQPPILSGTPDEDAIFNLIDDTSDEWWERVWAQLARPEIGFPVSLQVRILQDSRLEDRKTAIQKERRQGITDALIEAGEALLGGSSENSIRATEIEKWFEEHLDREGRPQSPWAEYIGLGDRHVIVQK